MYQEKYMPEYNMNKCYPTNATTMFPFLKHLSEYAQESTS